MIAGLVRLAGGRLALAGGDAEKTIPEQAHYLGHQDALKPSLTVAENLGFWTRYLGGAEPAADGLDAPWPRSGSAALADLPAAYLSAGQRRRLSLARLLAVSGRSGCSTSRPRRSTARPRTRWPDLMRRHLAGGGLIVAATHGPIGLDGAKRIAAGSTPHEPARRTLRARHAARRSASAAAAASACCSS